MGLAHATAANVVCLAHALCLVRFATPVSRRIKAFYVIQSLSKKNISQINKITLPMLGTSRCPRLKAKAAESRHIFPLMKDLVLQFRHLFGAKAGELALAVDGLLSFYDICASEPRDMSAAGLKQLQAAILQCLNSWKSYRGKLVFKFHMFFHLGERAASMGNPKSYWTYADEELNRQMGGIAKVLHKGPRFYLSFLQRVLVDEF